MAAPREHDRWMTRPVSRRALLAGAVGGGVVLGGCARTPAGAPTPRGAEAPAQPSSTAPPLPTSTPDPTPTPRPATAAEMAARATVPVLCYHQVRPWAADDSEYTRSVLVAPPERFTAQLDAIAEAGWTTIGPDDYLAHLRTGEGLPAKPVMLTFDDGKDNQHLTALPALAERGMTATWFIMTVIINSPGWTKPDDIKRAVDLGMTIGCHTWDHHNVREYDSDDFRVQYDEARATLQKHSGQAVESFAFPYGAWNEPALAPLADAGFTTAFQLDEQPVDAERPHLTLRRALAVSTWSGADVVARLDALRG